MTTLLYAIIEADQPMAALVTRSGYRRGQSDRSRLERLSIPEPNTGCWLWIGAARENGYGVFVKDGRNHQAHRAAYEEYRGPVAADQVVCHRCDVKICINPDHLFLGTQRDNVHDAIRKGRFAYRERALTSEQADEAKAMRLAGASYAAIGRRFGAGETTVKRYVNNTLRGRIVQ